MKRTVLESLTSKNYYMANAKTWILAFRPKTLLVSFGPILVGSALAFGLEGQIRWDLAIFALLSALCIQIGTNLINDAMDFKKGADTAERLGPLRVTQSGLLTPQQVLGAGLFIFALAVLFSIPLVIAGGWTIVIIGLVSLLAGYSYTGGPYPLAYLGLGDLFVLIFYGWVAVGGMYFLNTGSFSLHAWIAGTQIGLLATAVIAINNYRDRLTDVKANKKTLAVRLGGTLAKWEIFLLSFIPFVLGVFWLYQGAPWAFFLPLLAFPFAARLASKIRVHESGVIYNQFLAQSAALQLVFSLLLAIGFCLNV